MADVKQFLDIENLKMHMEYLYNSRQYDPDKYEKLLRKKRQLDTGLMTKRERTAYMDDIVFIAEESVAMSKSVMFALEQFIQKAKEGNKFFYSVYNDVASELIEIKGRVADLEKLQNNGGATKKK